MGGNRVFRHGQYRGFLISDTDIKYRPQSDYNMGSDHQFGRITQGDLGSGRDFTAQGQID